MYNRNILWQYNLQKHFYMTWRFWMLISFLGPDTNLNAHYIEYKKPRFVLHYIVVPIGIPLPKYVDR